MYVLRVYSYLSFASSLRHHGRHPEVIVFMSLARTTNVYRLIKSGGVRLLSSKSPLPDPEAAKFLQIVRLPKFLEPDSTQSLIAECVAIRDEIASAVTLSGPGRGVWSTTYLHTHHAFQNRNAELHKKLREAAILADTDAQWGLCAASLGDIRTRCVEFHDIGVSGGLPQKAHYDKGSCVTIDVMLQAPAAGGAFMTHAVGDNGEVMEVEVPFEQGDAVIFPSHKYHWVEPVTEGTRRVLIMELWRGEERSCNHRCEQPHGECTYKKAVFSSFIGM